MPSRAVSVIRLGMTGSLIGNALGVGRSRTIGWGSARILPIGNRSGNAVTIRTMRSGNCSPSRRDCGHGPTSLTASPARSLLRSKAGERPLDRWGRVQDAQRAWSGCGAKRDDTWSTCRDAIPVWIMPRYLVAEMVDPSPGRYDLVIVDEASQLGVEAFFFSTSQKRWWWWVMTSR